MGRHSVQDQDYTHLAVALMKAPSLALPDCLVAEKPVTLGESSSSKDSTSRSASGGWSDDGVKDELVVFRDVDGRFGGGVRSGGGGGSGVPASSASLRRRIVSCVLQGTPFSNELSH